MSIAKLFDAVPSTCVRMTRTSTVHGTKADIMECFDKLKQSAIDCGYEIKRAGDHQFTVESQHEYVTISYLVCGESATMTATHKKY